MREPIEISFGLRSRVGSRNYVLDGGPDPPWEVANLGEEGLIGTVCREPCKNGWTDRDAVWVVDSGRPRKLVLEGGPDHSCKLAIFTGKIMPGHVRWHSTVGYAKQPNQSKCRLGCGLKELCIRSPVWRNNFGTEHARRHSAVSCAKMAEQIGMPFGLWSRVGPMKHVLDGVHTGVT